MRYYEPFMRCLLTKYTFIHFHVTAIDWVNDESMKLLIATSEHHPPWNWQMERWTTAKVMDLLLKHLREKEANPLKVKVTKSFYPIEDEFSTASWYPFLIFSTLISTWRGGLRQANWSECHFPLEVAVPFAFQAACVLYIQLQLHIHVLVWYFSDPIAGAGSAD